MQNRILLVVVIVLSLVLIVVSSKENTTFFKPEKIEEKEQNKDISVLDTKTNSIDKLALEDYVIGVVAAEMPASFAYEALKAQAVASRTYATYKMEQATKDYDVVADVSNQSYITIPEMQKKWANDFNKYYNKIKEAVNDTKGEVMTYQDKVIESYYFAMSNGFTENVELVFSEEKDYLQSVPSVYDNSSLKNFEVTKEFLDTDICQKLKVTCPLKITDIKRSATNRVNTLKVNNEEFKGTVFRNLLGLRSTDFDINISEHQVLITTRGYGHGVGMSQYGANGMANAGKNYEEILKYYYKNVKITTI